MTAYALLSLSLAFLLTVLLDWATGLTLLPSWLVAINCVTFLLYGFDKLIAGSGRRRVPEAVLLMIAFLGGWPGAFVAMQLFRHKTAKASFKYRFWLVVALDLALAAAGWALVRALQAS